MQRHYEMILIHGMKANQLINLEFYYQCRALSALRHWQYNNDTIIIIQIAFSRIAKSSLTNGYRIKCIMFGTWYVDIAHTSTMADRSRCHHVETLERFAFTSWHHSINRWYKFPEFRRYCFSYSQLLSRRAKHMYKRCKLYRWRPT